MRNIAQRIRRNIKAMNNFGNWLLLELEKRGMSQSDLARAGGVSRAAVSEAISGRRKVGKDLAKGIAKGLDLPEEQVFREAGLLSPRKDIDEDDEEIMHQ